MTGVGSGRFNDRPQIVFVTGKESETAKRSWRSTTGWPLPAGLGELHRVHDDRATRVSGVVLAVLSFLTLIRRRGNECDSQARRLLDFPALGSQV
jgi:hypothetical protein